MLSDIINIEQSSFICGRLITNNVLLAMECIHRMKKKKFGKKGIMDLKLDMSKAYDMMEWNLVEGVLNSMGFLTLMVTLVMRCISYVSY